MSNYMLVTLEHGPIPDDLVPSGVEGYGNGQGMLARLEELSDLCDHFGLPRLDRFVVDRNVLQEQALEQAGWVDVPPRNWAPLHTDLTDHDYVAAQRRRWQIIDSVERAGPWFDAADGLRSVRGLIRLIAEGIPHELRIALWEARLRRLMDSGMDPDVARSIQRRPSPEFPLNRVPWSLRTYELELAYAEAHGDRFNFWVTY